MFYNQDSYTVKFYGDKIIRDELTIDQVPKLFNLVGEVEKYVFDKL